MRWLNISAFITHGVPFHDGVYTAVQRYTMNTVAIPEDERLLVSVVPELTLEVMRAPIMNMHTDPATPPYRRSWRRPHLSTSTRSHKMVMTVLTTPKIPVVKSMVLVSVMPTDLKMEGE